jgi:hypothetical protein
LGEQSFSFSRIRFAAGVSSYVMGFVLSCLCRSGFGCRFCVLLTKSVFCLFVCIVLYRSGVLQFFVDLVFCVPCLVFVCAYVPDFIFIFSTFCVLCSWLALLLVLSKVLVGSVRCGCEMGWSGCLELLRWSMCLELPLMYLEVLW